MDRRFLVVFGACLTQFTVIGLLFSYGLFFKIFEAEFGWSRAFLSSCTALAFFIMGMLAILGGRLNDRYGPRVVLGFTGVLYGVGYMLMSEVSAPWHLLAIFGIFVALGLSTHDVVTLSTIARWFERRRGIMTGVVKLGTAAGQVAIPPLAALLIASLGWRSALFTLGIGAMVLLLMAAVAMAKPSVDGKMAGSSQPMEPPGLSFAEARRTRVFWTMCAIQFLFFPTLTTIPLHVAVHAMDMAMTAPMAAGLLSVIGAASVAGRLTVGTSADRVGGRGAYIICFLPLIGSLAVLLVLDTPNPLFVVMAVYGFAHGGLFTVVSPTVAEYFGTRAHGAIFGVILFCGTFGGAIGPILAGWVFDTMGAYAPAFAALLGMAAIGLALAISLPTASRQPVA